MGEGPILKSTTTHPRSPATRSRRGQVDRTFKTDADIAGRLDEYRVQLLLYLRAISLSTGAPARGVLMCV